MIKKKQIPYNSIVCKQGRLVELFELKERVKKCYYFRMPFVRPSYKRRVDRVTDKIQSHIIWYAKKKYPDMPEMHFERFKGGWVLYPVRFVCG